MELGSSSSERETKSVPHLTQYFGRLFRVLISLQRFPTGCDSRFGVATSGNGSEIARIEKQFEQGVTAQDLQRIQGPEQRPPLGVSGKFRLAVAKVSDPFAVVTTAMDAEVGNATAGSSPLRRGVAGFGQRFGTAMAGAATGEFFSTFAYASIFHQDPHYYRSPDASTGTRLRRAFSYVLVTHSDSGKKMFNFDEFLGTASSSLLESTFHPEWKKDPGAAAGES